MVYFLLSNLYFYTYFHLSPLLDHHFLVFEEGRLLNISAEKLVVPKSEKANITCDMRFFPCCVAIFRLRKYISLTHSLPKNVGVWTRSHIKKKCFLHFSTFSYNLTTEILIHNSFINCICFDFLSIHSILTQNFLKTSKSTLFTLLNLKVLLGLYYRKLAW